MNLNLFAKIVLIQLGISKTKRLEVKDTVESRAIGKTATIILKKNVKYQTTSSVEHLIFEINEEMLMKKMHLVYWRLLAVILLLSTLAVGFTWWLLLIAFVYLAIMTYVIYRFFLDQEKIIR